MLEIVLTPEILGPPKIGGRRLKPFQPEGKSAPATKHFSIAQAVLFVCQ